VEEVFGYTGGTVDKFESIPGFKMDYTIKEIEEMINKNNIVIASQSKELVPADKKIYELRDTIACTNSKPLIVSSILSKKIASGANNIVIDITYGSGAFMKTKKDAKELKTLMQEIGKMLGVKIKAVISSMETPLRILCWE
jgi:pyrimidine-nucleoside phosphorylase